MQTQARKDSGTFEKQTAAARKTTHMQYLYSVLKFGVLASPLHVQNTRTKVTARQGELELFV